MRKKILISALLVVAAIVAIWFFLFRDDAPPPPDAQSAAAVAKAAQTTTTIPSTTSGDSTTTTTTATTTTLFPPTPPAEVQVLVLNGSCIPGVAGTVTDMLIPQGYATLPAGNAFLAPYSSGIYFRTGSAIEARVIQEYLAPEYPNLLMQLPERGLEVPDSAVDRVNQADVVIIVADDGAIATAEMCIKGSWMVDTSIGSFEDFSNSYVGFRIEEELAQGIGKTTAVGRTPVVSGTLEFSNSELLSAEIIADLSQITTDRSWRDDNVYDALDAGNHPNAVFSLVGPITLDDSHIEGKEHLISATGELTIKGVTQEVSVELTAQRIGQIITVTGQFPMVFSDFGVEVPTAPIVLSVEDNGLIEVQLFLTPAS